jgi:hypothetical protein
MSEFSSPFLGIYSKVTVSEPALTAKNARAGFRGDYQANAA